MSESVWKDPEKLWRYTVGTVLFLLATWFTLNGTASAFAVYHPFPVSIFAASLLLFVVAHKPIETIGRAIFTKGSPRLISILLFVAGFAASALYSYYVFEAIPHSIDGIAYLFQAKIFALGKLRLNSPTLPEFFDYVFVINDGRWFILFQPMWPLALAVGVLIGAPWLVAPLLGGIALVVTYRLGRRTVGEVSARIGALFLLISPLFVGINASMLNHTMAMVLTVFAFFFAVVAHQDKKGWAAVLSGAFLGLIFTTRVLNGLVLAPLVIGFLILSAAQGKLKARWVFAALGSTAAFAALQLLYNYLQTGHPLSFPQDYYFNITEPIKNCHRLGFGKKVGCPVVHPFDHFPNGFTPDDAVFVTHRRLSTFTATITGWSGYYLLIYVGLAFLHKRSPYRYWFFGTFLALAAGYFFFYFHGVWGRYYYSSLPFLALIMGDTIFGLYKAAKNFGENHLPKLKNLITAIPLAFAFSMGVFILAVFTPIFIQGLGHHLFGVDSALKRQVEEQKLKNAIVFISPQYYANGFQLQELPIEDADVIYALDLAEYNQNLVNLYPNRKYYYWKIPARKLVPLNIHPNPNKITIYPAAKPPRVYTSGEYATRIDINGFPINGKKPDPEGPHMFAFTLWAIGVGSFAEFRHPIFREGTYKAKVVSGLSPSSCEFKIDINSQTLDGRFGGYSEKEIQLTTYNPNTPIMLPEGIVPIRITVTKKDERIKLGCFANVLKIELTRIGDVPAGTKIEPPTLVPMHKLLEKNLPKQSSSDAMRADLMQYWQTHRFYYQPHFIFWMLFAIPLFWLIPRRKRYKELILVALSVGFICMLWGVGYGLVVSAVPIAIYFITEQAHIKLRTQKHRKLFMAVSVLTIVLIYLLLLYNEQPQISEGRFRFMVIPFLHIAGIAYMLPKLIHYVVERMRGGIKIADPLSAAVYFLFFPTWRMGPIERYPEFKETLDTATTNHLKANDIAYGFWRIGLGAAKSALFFAFFEQFTAGTYFNDYQTKTPFMLLLGMFGGVFAVYLDFGGYADWSIGVSRLLGIRLSENFVRPFSSPNLGIWWRKWHITLARWVRDYIYIPLGGSRRGNVYLNYMIAFGAVGVWHHLSWHFLVWGALQGLGLAFVRTWRMFWIWIRETDDLPAWTKPFVGLQLIGDALPWARYALAVAITNLYFALTAAYFAADIHKATNVLLKVLTWGHW